MSHFFPSTRIIFQQVVQALNMIYHIHATSILTKLFMITPIFYYATTQKINQKQKSADSFYPTGRDKKIKNNYFRSIFAVLLNWYSLLSTYKFVREYLIAYFAFIFLRSTHFSHPQVESKTEVKNSTFSLWLFAMTND